MPVAVTVKFALSPTFTVLSAGGVAIDGAAGAGFTVKVALLLVVLPLMSVTVTAKRAPLSATVVAGVVYFDLVAPPTGKVFFDH